MIWLSHFFPASAGVTRRFGRIELSLLARGSGSFGSALCAQERTAAVGPAPLPREKLKLTTRYRQGERSTPARAGHTADTTQWKRAIARAVLDVDVVVAVLQVTGDMDVAARAAGVSVAAIWGRMRWDHGAAVRIEEVLTSLCGGEHCGTARGYKDGGRCAGCREAKAVDRGPRRMAA